MVAPRKESAPRQVRDEYRWFAVHTLPHREMGARRQLEFQGFEAFLPLHLRTVRHARRFSTTKTPFFPRYLFVRMNLARTRWRSINGTFGVSGLVMGHELPKPVPRGIVEAFLAIADAEGVLAFTPWIERGQKVRILTGPLADRIGELIEADGQARVQVLLEAMGASVVVRSSGEALAPVA